MGMGAHSLFRRRTAQRASHCRGSDNVYADGTERRRTRTLYRLTQPALDYKAAMEPLHRPAAHKTLVDSHHADTHRRITGRRGIHAQHASVVPGLHVLLLHHGLCQCHARHIRRRILYDRPRRAHADLLRGHTQHILSPCGHLRQQRAGGHPGRTAGDVSQQDSIHVEPRVLRPCGSIME